MKQIATWLMVVIWFFHLAIGAGALAAAYRLWPERGNQFVRYTLIHLNAGMIDALGAIVAVFLAKNVFWTWKFAITVFVAMLLRDLARVPLIRYILRGPDPIPADEMPKEVNEEGQ